MKKPKLLKILKKKSSGGCRLGRFLCACGNRFTTSLWAVKTGRTKSCSCYQKQRASEANKTHGDSRSSNRLYRIYKNVKTRATNPNNRYHQAGIRMSKKWQNSYIEFRKWALANGYNDELTIDRIDNNKGYYPKNCRWITMCDQTKNKQVYKSNKLGIRGVDFDKRRKKYRAQIQLNRKKTVIGHFDTAKEASLAYEIRRAVLFKIAS
jgi:hypothetical protein